MPIQSFDMAARRIPLALVVLGALLGALAPVVAPVGRAAEPWPVRDIHFPVEGKTWYMDDFGAPRVGHTHQGNDIFGKKLQVVLATRNGYLSWWSTDASGSAGNYLVLTDLQGWTYWYMHLNNDSPGTDDGKNPPQWKFFPGIKLGRYVLRGEPIAYLGDSGNAEGTSPHVHFEIHDPAGNVVNPYPSLQAAGHEARPVAVSVAGHPDGGHYVLTADKVVRFGDAPSYAALALDEGTTAVDIDLAPTAKGYAVLDSAGGVHGFGTAKSLPALEPGYLGGAPPRAVALTADGAGYVVLDGFGRVHASPGVVVAPPPSVHDGVDSARDIELMPDGAGYTILEKDGRLTNVGSATALSAFPATVYSSGKAKRLVVSPTGAGYAVLGKGGKVQARGDLAGLTSPMYLPNATFVGIDEVAGTVSVIKKSGLHTRWVSSQFLAAYDAAA